MNEACSYLEKISKTSSRNEKEAILQHIKSKGGDLERDFKFLMETALNPFLNYGVAEIEEQTPYVGETNYEQLVNLRKILVDRVTRGNEARILLRVTLNVENQTTRHWLIKCFSKDMRAGISEKTINKVWPRLIPTFEVALCKSFDDLGELPKGTWIAEPKMDGLRALMFVSKSGKVQQVVSRNNKPMYNIDRIIKQVEDIDFKMDEDFILDGEMGNDWNESASILHTSNGEHPAEEKLIYYVFDMVTVSEFTSRKTAPWHQRMVRLIPLTLSNKSNVIDIKERKDARTYAEAHNAYTLYLAEGFEGAVLKEINSEYPFGRSKYWLKWKPVETFDVKIVGYEEGTGQNKGKLGAFIVNHKGKKVNIGGGYTQEQREEFWRIRDKMIGKVIEVEAGKETKDGSLRFPEFIRVREDKS
jgi:DNA ligase-1